MRNGRSKVKAAAKGFGLAVLVAAAFAVAVLPRVIGYKWLLVRGPSVNATLGLLKPGIPEQLRTGGYVLMVWRGVDPNGGSKLQEGTAIVKKVGHIRHETIGGRPLALYGRDPAWKSVSPRRTLFAYDSRYFGLIPFERLLGEIRVII
jgi:hypothetical protein